MLKFLLYAPFGAYVLLVGQVQYGLNLGMGAWPQGWLGLAMPFVMAALAYGIGFANGGHHGR